MSKSKKRADAFVKQMRSSALYMNPPRAGQGAIGED